MKKILIRETIFVLIIISLFVFLTACVEQGLDKVQKQDLEETVEEPELELESCEPFDGAEVCTAQFDPVCAKIEKNGMTEWRTFSNACNACISGEGVVGYKMGEC